MAIYTYHNTGTRRLQLSDMEGLEAAQQNGSTRCLCWTACIADAFIPASDVPYRPSTSGLMIMQGIGQGLALRLAS